MNDSKQLKLYWILPGGYSVTRESLSIPAYHRDDVNAVIATERAERFAAEQRILYLEAREKRLMELVDKIEDETGWNKERK